MIDVLFFASVREKMGCSKIQLPAQATLKTIMDVLQHIDEEFQSDLVRQYHDKKLIIAHNQEISDASASVKSGDEVAFFPPVSGG